MREELRKAQANYGPSANFTHMYRAKIIEFYSNYFKLSEESIKELASAIEEAFGPIIAQKVSENSS